MNTIFRFPVRVIFVIAAILIYSPTYAIMNAQPSSKASIEAKFTVLVNENCSGVLIEPNLVLTAAHCVSEKGFALVQFATDFWSENIDVETRFGVAVKHPSYEQTRSDFDIALIFLTVAAPETYEPININFDAGVVDCDDCLMTLPTTKIAGFGLGFEKGYEIFGVEQSKMPGYLRSAEIDFVEKICNSFFSVCPEDIHSSFPPTLGTYTKTFHFAPKNYGQKPQHGDSGGPIFSIQIENGIETPRLIGISIALVDMIKKRPLGLNILPFKNWIESKKSSVSTLHMFEPFNFIPKFSSYDQAVTTYGKDLLVAEADPKFNRNTGLIFIDGDTCEITQRKEIKYVGELEKNPYTSQEVDVIRRMLTNSTNRVYTVSNFALFELNPETGTHTLLKKTGRYGMDVEEQLEEFVFGKRVTESDEYSRYRRYPKIHHDFLDRNWRIIAEPLTSGRNEPRYSTNIKVVEAKSDSVLDTIYEFELPLIVTKILTTDRNVFFVSEKSEIVCGTLSLFTSTGRELTESQQNALKLLDSLRTENLLYNKQLK